MKKILVTLCSLFMAGCTGYPKNISPVTGFELPRYLGTWYEIARLDHRFERGLSNVTAHYSLKDDGGIAVINRGYSLEKKEWSSAEGTGYFVREADEGYLKVSFFGPFYGSYVIFELDQEHYQYAYVSGPDPSYLWFLSRTPEISDQQRRDFVNRVQALGYPVAELIFVEHHLWPQNN